MLTRMEGLTLDNRARQVPGCAVEMWHDGLRKHRLVRGRSAEIVSRKAAAQAAEWDARWQVVDGRQRDQDARLSGPRHADAGRTLASERTALAQQDLHQLAALLKFTLAVYDPVDWEMLKDSDPFLEKKPMPEPLPAEPAALELPREPQPKDDVYRPALGLLDWLLPTRRAKEIGEGRARFAADHELWSARADELRNERAESLRKHFAWMAHRAEAQAFQVGEWELRKREFLARKAAANAAVDEIRHAYFALVPEAVAEYCDLVLSQSQYPDWLPKEFEVAYEDAAKLLVVDYLLPAPTELPTLAAVEYDASRDAFIERHIAAPQAAELYDSVLHQLALRTAHELFEADTAGALDTVVFNGIVPTRDPGTGGNGTACILSLRVHRAEFQPLHLSQIDPKTCFQALGGVGGERLHELAPVTPMATRSASTSAGREPSADR